MCGIGGHGFECVCVPAASPADEEGKAVAVEAKVARVALQGLEEGPGELAVTEEPAGDCEQKRAQASAS